MNISQPDLFAGIQGLNLHSIPKIDLHRHIAGSVRPATAWELSKRTPEGASASSLQDFCQSLMWKKPAENLDEFITRPWSIINKILNNPAALRRITYEVVEDAHCDNVAYVELRLVALRGPSFPVESVIRSACQGLQQAAADFPATTARLILGLDRSVVGHWKPESIRRHTEKILVAAEPYRQQWIVGFDLSGREDSAPVAAFKEYFKLVKQAGYRVTVHAGEVGPASEVLDAILICGADRIGHGLSAATSHETLQMLKDRNISLEICPSSNLLTGSVATLVQHPLTRLISRSVKFSINTDDPTVCNTTSSTEFESLMKGNIINEDAMWGILNDSIDTSFADEQTKSKLRERLNTARKSVPGGPDADSDVKTE